jgi:hypothetical protein
MADDRFLFVADQAAIRRVDVTSGLVDTVTMRAGGGGETYSPNPLAIAIASDGVTMYVADMNGTDSAAHIRVMQVHLSFSASGITGTATTLVGGPQGSADGMGTNARFVFLRSIALQGNGLGMFIGESFVNRIRHVSMVSPEVNSVEWSEHVVDAQSYDVTSDILGNCYIAGAIRIQRANWATNTTWEAFVRKLNAAGTVQWEWRSNAAPPLVGSPPSAYGSVAVATSITLDDATNADTDIVVAGWFTRACTFGQRVLQARNSSSDMFVQKVC